MTTRRKRSAKSPRIEALIGEDRELFKGLLKESLQEVLEAEMTETVGAGLGERTAVRTGYRSGYYSRGLVTRVGKLELRVPRDGYVAYCVQKLLSRKSGHGTRLLVEVDLLTKE